MFEIVEQRIELDRVIRAVGRPDAGAIATFVGTTRDHNAGREVIRLEYEAYPEMALREMERIAAQAIERFAVKSVAMAHRVGVVEIGEASVAIAVSAGHRDAAFAAFPFAIDRLKENVARLEKGDNRGGGNMTGPAPVGPRAR